MNRQFFIHDVCALHEQERTLVVSSRKSRKIQINFQLYKGLYSKCAFFSRGCKSLMRRGNVLKHYPPAGGKVVYREVCTEGSQTAKSSTDEQKRYMRL